MQKRKVKIIGAGLAGCEAAWQIANAGLEVEIYEMKPHKYTDAHTYKGFSELVCSNSLKALRLGSAGGLLKEEMRALGSVILECAQECSVPAGGALAVDREKFSDSVTAKITSHPNIKIVNQEVTSISQLISATPPSTASLTENKSLTSDSDIIIVAAGPLCADKLAEDIKSVCGEGLSFYDAVSPIVSAGSIDFENAFYAARYQRGGADYINCPLNKDEYDIFINELVSAQTVPVNNVDRDRVYEGCMPIEVLAKRGHDSLRFGPLRPVGLIDPKTERRPWAVLQLRKENTAGEMYNLVGFQTNLKWSEQKRVFSLIPALGNAEFTRYGVMHRNTFIKSPEHLDKYLRLKTNPSIFFAGQITGVEGYTESAACGIFVGMNVARTVKGEPLVTLPESTMTGELMAYLVRDNKDFQPMGANMGLLPPLKIKEKNKQKRYEKLAENSLNILQNFLRTTN